MYQNIQSAMLLVVSFLFAAMLGLLYQPLAGQFLADLRTTFVLAGVTLFTVTAALLLNDRAIQTNFVPHRLGFHLLHAAAFVGVVLLTYAGYI